MDDRSKRIFSEKEAADLVLRAAELKEETPEYVAGLSFDELVAMGDELGVEHSYLEKALTEQQGPDRSFREKREGVLGFEYAREFEAVVNGEIDPERFDVVMDHLAPVERGGGIGMGAAMRHRRAQMNPKQLGRSVTGAIKSGIGYGSFSMTSRNGRTKLKARSNVISVILATGNPILICTVFGVLGLEESSFPTWISLGVFVLGLLIATVAVGIVAKLAHKRVEEKFRNVVASVRAEVESAQAPVDQTARSAGDRIDLQLEQS